MQASDNHFGEVVYKYRVNKGLSLRNLAKKLDVSPSFISMMEKNKNIGTASEETIKHIALILGINEKKLLDLARKVSTEELNKRHNEALAFFRKRLK